MNAKRFLQNRGVVVAAAVIVGGIAAMSGCSSEPSESPGSPGANDTLAPSTNESLGVSTIEVDGTAVQVSGERSISRTVVRYGLPAGLQELGVPVLVTADGSRILPIEVSGGEGARVASFPSTPFGSTVEFHLSSLGKTESTTAERRAVIALGAVLDRHGLSAGDSGSFAIGQEDINLASGLRILAEGELGVDPGGRTWVSFQLDGSFRPADVQGACPCVFDANGESLPVRTVGTGFSKDAHGNILPGVSEVSALYSASSSDLSFVTLVSGGMVQVIAVQDVAVLAPGP